MEELIRLEEREALDIDRKKIISFMVKNRQLFFDQFDKFYTDFVIRSAKEDKSFGVEDMELLRKFTEYIKTRI